MRYLLAILVPPLAIAVCGRWVHFIINLIFFVLAIPMIAVLGIGIVMWVMCIVHALAVCRMSSVDKRVDRIVRAVESQRAAPAQSK